MSRLTIFLARSVGIFAVLLTASLLLRGSATVAAAVADEPVMLVYAIASLALGIAMILGHNIWTGGALPVVVTLVGWAIMAKGLVLLLLPPGTLIWLLENSHYREHLDLYLMPSLFTGLYLTGAGFKSQSTRRQR